MLNKRLEKLLIEASQKPQSCFGWVADYTTYLHGHGETWVTAEMLRHTEQAHAVHEKAGGLDRDWVSWYANNLATIKQHMEM